MRHRRRLATVLAIVAGLLAPACNMPSEPSIVPRGPSPSPPAPPPLGVETSYAATIDLGPGCESFADDLRQRTYTVTLRTTSSYYGMTVQGGGFSVPKSIGDLWYHGLLRWNTNEDGFCDGSVDGVPEPLSLSRSLWVCGRGTVTLGDPTIAGSIDGVAWIQEAGQKTATCSGPFRFSFTKSQASSF